MAKIPDIKEEITIPDNIQVKMEDKTLTISGEKGSISRIFKHPTVKVKHNGNKIEINCKNPRRKEKALAYTFNAHIKNMMHGVTQGFEYQMKTVFSHFPIKTGVEGDEFLIHNFLGERAPRKAKILEGVNVEAKGENITVTGIDKEKVGQTVANIERATKVKYRDIRVFQDGVYQTAKGGRS